MGTMISLTEQLSEKELSRIFDLLKHLLRRAILRQLSENPQTYSQLLKKLNIKESSLLNYHLRKMEGLLIEKDDEKYKLSEVGRICLQLILKVKEKEGVKKFRNLQQLVEDLKLKAFGVQIAFFLLVTTLLLELCALNVIDSSTIITRFVGGIAFSSTLLYFMNKKYSGVVIDSRNKEKIEIFILILTIWILIQTIIQITFEAL
ncbi:MAG: helix-turn-helix domain-containing protein [Candidatus Heimdallarchaeota archaeon]